MARMTKAEREAAELERQRQFEVEEQLRLRDMPLTLLRLMARAEAAGLDYNVRTLEDNSLSFEFRDKYGDPVKLTLTSSDSMVRTVECDVEMAEFEQAETRRKMALRAAALAKLTDEDRKALGL